MKNERDEQRTPKQVAKDFVSAAIGGRMEDLRDEVNDRLPESTPGQRKEVQRHIDNYLRRLAKVVK